MSTRQIHIFISHSWAHSKHYDTLYDWIFSGNWSVGQASLNFLNYSIPKNDPIHNASNDTQLYKAICNKVSRSHVVIIPTGIYASHSKWIKKEIEAAKYYNKPIIAVNPFGQQKKASVVLSNANAKIGWNKKSLINKIWELYQNG